MNAATRFHCRTCQTSRFIPKRREEIPLRINVGCEECRNITSHQKTGFVYERPDKL